MATRKKSDLPVFALEKSDKSSGAVGKIKLDRQSVNDVIDTLKELLEGAMKDTGAKQIRGTLTLY